MYQTSTLRWIKTEAFQYSLSGCVWGIQVDKIPEKAVSVTYNWLMRSQWWERIISRIYEIYFILIFYLVQWTVPSVSSYKQTWIFYFAGHLKYLLSSGRILSCKRFIQVPLLRVIAHFHEGIYELCILECKVWRLKFSSSFSGNKELDKHCFLNTVKYRKTQTMAV